MVLLPLRGRDRIARSRPAEALVLRNYRSRGVLRDHESAVQAGACDEIFGQAAQAVDQLVGPPLGDRSELGHGDSERVHGDGDRLAVEIAGRDDHVLVREDVRVVGGRVDFVLDHGLDIQDVVFDCAVDLRDAAEAVRVLDVLLRPADEFAALEHLHETLAREDLAHMRAELVGQREERLDTAVVGVKRHGPDEVRPFRKAHGLEDGPDSVRAHELRAVEQRQALLGLEGDRLPALFGPHFSGRTNAALVQHLAQPDQRQAHVRERREIAGRSERTLLVHDRQHVFVEHVDQPLHGLQLYARMPVRQALRLQEQHQLHDLRTDGRAGAASVRNHQVVLQLRQLVGRDVHVVQRTEARRDAVDRLRILHFGVQVTAAFLNRFHCLLA